MCIHYPSFPPSPPHKIYKACSQRASKALRLNVVDLFQTFVGDIDLVFGPGSGIFELEEDRTINGQSRVSIRLVDDDLLTEMSYDLQVSKLSCFT